MSQEILLTAITILLGVIGYFVKRILDKTDKISEDMEDIKPKVLILWEREFASSKSPLQLNERGQEILSTTGIKEMVDELLPALSDAVKNKSPQNAYHVQEYTKEVITKMKDNSELLNRLQEGAFRLGVDVDAVLFVGSLYLRDMILKEMNFKFENVDRKEETSQT